MHVTIYIENNAGGGRRRGLRQYGGYSGVVVPTKKMKNSYSTGGVTVKFGVVSRFFFKNSYSTGGVTVKFGVVSHFFFKNIYSTSGETVDFFQTFQKNKNA